MTSGSDEGDEKPERTDGRPPVPRYLDRGRIGSGGMGQVRKVWDAHLERELAMKILSFGHKDNEDLRRRFLMETRVLGRLTHPGIVAIHEQGEDAEGRLWFTMRLVRGKTLTKVIRELHRGSEGGEWPASDADGWTLYRVVDAFKRVCDAVAYAHAQGIIHRDLKPSNLMIGEFGEVQVMDWGVAKVPGESFVSLRAGATPTNAGDVLGTPAYMAPEQALGEHERVGPPADVYSLGACLFTVLRNRAWIEDGPVQALLRVAMGKIDKVTDDLPESHPPLPPALVQICHRAMSFALDDRHADAAELAADLAAYLEGAKRREQARSIVAEANALSPQIHGLREQAAQKRREAASVLAALPVGAPPEEKKAGWAIEDDAAALERDAQQVEVRWLQQVRSALNVDADLPEAHDSLAGFYAERLLDAEARRHSADAARYAALLADHARTAEHRRVLAGEGALHLVTDPPGATVDLYRFEERHRRLVPVFEETLGTTPLAAVPLRHGSYLLEIKAEGRVPVRYPVHLDRGESWDGVRPGDDRPFPIWLPRPEDLEEDEVYIPAGWFWSGDERALESLPVRRIWVDAFAMGRFPVTCAEYLAFLDDLVARGDEQGALRHAPREQETDLSSAVIRDGARHRLGTDRDGTSWRPDWPMVMVDWHDGRAYAAWRSDRSGQSFRLPDELEFEKAARGPDRRSFAWGNCPEPTFACLLRSRPGDPSRTSVSEFPVDDSVYGVRGTVGNVREVCENVWLDEGPCVVDGRLVVSATDPDDPRIRAARGGGWYSAPNDARAAGRFAAQADGRYLIGGFRLARSLASDD